MCSICLSLSERAVSACGRQTSVQARQPCSATQRSASSTGRPRKPSTGGSGTAGYRVVTMPVRSPRRTQGRNIVLSFSIPPVSNQRLRTRGQSSVRSQESRLEYYDQGPPVEKPANWRMKLGEPDSVRLYHARPPGASVNSPRAATRPILVQMLLQIVL